MGFGEGDPAVVGPDPGLDVVDAFGQAAGVPILAQGSGLGGREKGRRGVIQEHLDALHIFPGHPGPPAGFPLLPRTLAGLHRDADQLARRDGAAGRQNDFVVVPGRVEIQFRREAVGPLRQKGHGAQAVCPRRVAGHRLDVQGLVELLSASSPGPPDPPCTGRAPSNRSRPGRPPRRIPSGPLRRYPSPPP